MNSIFEAAYACLRAATPDDKLALTFATADAFARGERFIDALTRAMSAGEPDRER